MSSILNATKLISTIKRRAFLPNDQVTYSNDDFLEMATEEINVFLMDQIIEARGDYLVYDITMALDINQTDYTIPSRAHGDKLRAIEIVDENGDIVYDNLSQVSMDVPTELRTANTFFVRNNKVVLSEFLLDSNHFLKMYFYLRPNKLVQVNRAATITSITPNGDSTSTLAFTTLPAHFTAQLQYDFTSAKSPNKVVKFDKTPTAINLTLKTITFNDSDILEVSVGDYVTQAEESIVPNIPTEYHPVVAQRVAVACLEGMGDEQNKQSAERKLAQMEKAVLKIVTNRVEGQPKKIRQINSPLFASIKHRNRTY
jgi:hypothetical protein